MNNYNQNGVGLHVEGCHTDDLMENYQTGYIKLFRSICKHWIWKDERKLKWWLTILMECNHKSEKFNLGYTIYEVLPGQKYYSLRTWGNLFNCGTKAVKNFFVMLEKDQMITVKTVGKGKHSTTLLTICNWGSYQRGKTIKETLSTTQGKRKGNARGIQLKNDNNDKKEEEVVFTFKKVFLLKAQKEFRTNAHDEQNCSELSKTLPTNGQTFERALMAAWDNAGSIDRINFSPTYILKYINKFTTSKATKRIIT